MYPQGLEYPVVLVPELRYGYWSDVSTHHQWVLLQGLSSVGVV